MAPAHRHCWVPPLLLPHLRQPSETCFLGGAHREVMPARGQHPQVPGGQPELQNPWVFKQARSSCTNKPFLGFSAVCWGFLSAQTPVA